MALSQGCAFLAFMLIVTVSVTAAHAANVRPTQISICVAPDGGVVIDPKICRRSRTAPTVCTCRRQGTEVLAPVCQRGEKPLRDTAEVKQARRAALDHGGLLNATFEGKRFCVNYYSPSRDGPFDSSGVVAPNMGVPQG
jgi:hypothetical protein